MLPTFLERHPQQGGGQAAHLLLRNHAHLLQKPRQTERRPVVVRVQDVRADLRPRAAGQAAGQEVREEGVQSAHHPGEKRLPQSRQRTQAEHGESCYGLFLFISSKGSFYYYYF